MNSERKNYPMKQFRAIFSISSILVIRSGYAKKDHISILAVIPISLILVIRSGYAKKGHFPILAVFQNVWDLHKFGLQIWIQNAKITLWDLHKFGLQIWIQNAKITLWKNFGQFFRFHRFHRFWSSGPGMQKKITSQYL